MTNTSLMHHRILLLCLALSSLSTAFGQGNNTSLRPDTLQRELVLEREFVPSAAEARKEFFNPLAGNKTTQALKPLRFANNTYGVDMSIRPRLFDPVFNSYAPEADPRNWHIRLYGGFPNRIGLNLGMHFNAGENGALDIAIDHDSQKGNIINPRVNFKPLNITHDTELGIRFSHKLETRTLGITASVYNNMESLYALPSDFSAKTDDVAKGPLYHTFLFRRTGGELGFELSPAPLLNRSAWQYSIYARGGYASQQIPAQFHALFPVLLQSTPGSITNPQDTENGDPEKQLLGGYDLKAGGSLAYGLKVYNFNFGADVSFEMSGMSMPGTTGVANEVNSITATPMVFSADPFLSYVNDQFMVKGGVKVQLLNGVGRAFLLAPNVHFRWQAHELFSLLIDADGGGDLTGFKELYEINRYALTPYRDPAMDVARYRISAGFELGNIYGFSASLKAGYADYHTLYDWQSVLAGPATAGRLLPGIVYATAQRQNVKALYVEAGARYISPIGLTVFGGFRYDKYTAPEAETTVSGRPSFTMDLGAEYRFTPEWSLAASFKGLGWIIQRYNYSQVAVPEGIPSPEDGFGVDERGGVERPFITDLSLRLSYDFSKYAGLSLIGTNLLNQKESRWLGYDRPGAGIMAALTLHF